MPAAKLRHFVCRYRWLVWWFVLWCCPTQGMRQWQDAAMLYETAGAYEKAAEIHITTKNFAQAAPLMSSISTPKLHLLYAQAKEAEGKTAIGLPLPMSHGCLLVGSPASTAARAYCSLVFFWLQGSMWKRAQRMKRPVTLMPLCDSTWITCATHSVPCR